MLTVNDSLLPKSAMLAAILDALHVGVALTAHDGRVLHLNEAARSFIKLGGGLCLVNGRLSCSSPAAARELITRIGSAGNDAPAAASLGIARRDGTGLLLTIVAMSSEPAAYPAERGVAVFMQDPDVAAFGPGEAFATLYGLTPSELRVVLALHSGLTVKDVAERLGLSSETVKTHLAHVFQKTGTGRQANLLSLVSRTLSPVRRWRP
jgi:DNA-binding CsgD family transcriptional regulator